MQAALYQEAVEPFAEAIDIVKEEGGKALELCYQCGLCTGSCPWNLVRSFLPRKLIHEAQLGLIDFEEEDMWLCVSCRACVQVCPRGVEIIDIIRSFRRTITGLGTAVLAVGGCSGGPAKKAWQLHW